MTLREDLKEAGISQREAARILQISERTVRRWCAHPTSKSYSEPPYATMEFIRFTLLKGNK